jgi:predicted AAA+ superfamily ATPase
MTEITMDRVYRTQHLRRLREALSARPLVYLGGCFGSGKTVLLHQMAETPGIENKYLSCAAPDAAAQAEAFSTPGARCCCWTTSRK